MAIQHPDIQPAVNHSVQVAIAGAGPVGLMMANYLGQMGIDVLVVEKLGNDSNLLIVFYVQIMPDDFVMQLHRF